MACAQLRNAGPAQCGSERGTGVVPAGGMHMGGWKRVFAIGLIWAVAAVGWMILGGVTQHRESTQS